MATGNLDASYSYSQRLCAARDLSTRRCHLQSTSGMLATRGWIGVGGLVKCHYCGGEHDDWRDIRTCFQATQPPTETTPSTNSAREVTVLPDGAENRPSSLTPTQKHAAAKNRIAHPTEAEALLWAHLQERRLNGFTFHREFEILGWFTDFYCPAARLVVEVDGREHRDRRAADNRRDEVMRANHYRVLRIPAVRIYRDLDDVVDQISGAVNFEWARSRRDKWAKQRRANTNKPPISKETQLPIDERSIPRILERQTLRPRKGRFQCPRCTHSFVTDIDGQVECRRCLIVPIPVCSRCSSVGRWVSLDDRVCRRCADISAVARQQAGSGVTPQGALSDQRGRAKKIF